MHDASLRHFLVPFLAAAGAAFPLMWATVVSAAADPAWQAAGCFAVATVLFSLDALRAVNGIARSGASTMLGVLALVSGFVQVWNVDLPLWAISALLLTASLVAKPV